MIRVIGIDPGLRNMGWGVIDVAGSRITHVANGICQSEGVDLATRLLSLHAQLTRIMVTYRPDAAAVEQSIEIVRRRPHLVIRIDGRVRQRLREQRLRIRHPHRVQ